MPLRAFDNDNFNLMFSKTGRRKHLNKFDNYIARLKYKCIKQEFILICDSSKISSIYYTIFVIAKFDDPSNLTYLI